MKKLFIIASVLILGFSLSSCCNTCKKTKPTEVKGSKWALVELNGKIVDRVAQDPADRLTLILGEDGRVNGKGDCNGFFGGYTLEKEKINISNLGSTRMFCPDQALENQYLEVLQSAEKIKIDGEYMLLMDKDAKLIASFKKVN